MKKTFWIFLLSSISLNAQRVIFKGKLLDVLTKKPVVYANISFLNSEKGISSNEDGSFAMYLDKLNGDGDLILH